MISNMSLIGKRLSFISNRIYFADTTAMMSVFFYWAFTRTLSNMATKMSKSISLLSTSTTFILGTTQRIVMKFQF